MPPGYREQVEFLGNVQRLLSEGDFTATYKFALLLSLADLAVQKGDDSGAELIITTAEIAEKFVEYYWRQARPYAAKKGLPPQVLVQNNERQATVVSAIAGHQASSLADLKRDPKAWDSLVRSVRKTIEKYPLPRLQTMGRQEVAFLYENRCIAGTITLRPGVAACLRRFHSLIHDLVRGAWVRWIRQNKQNQVALGEASDMHEFLFGSERDDLSAVRPILHHIQKGECFYCGSKLDKEKAAVDHFIPWSWYPVDLGHNFVLADEKCNGSKADTLAAVRHLESWFHRNEDHGLVLANECDSRGLVHDIAASMSVARWAYEQVELSGGQVWVKKGKPVELVTLDASWRNVLGRAA